MRTSAKSIALGGVMAALAVVIMSLGGMIPIATYCSPVICMMIESVVLRAAGKKTAWAWYGVVALLSLLLSPDREAAAVFLFLGYYPIVKPEFEKKKCRWVWKLLFFNAVVLAMYWILMHVMGMEELAQEMNEVGAVLNGVLLLLGNLVFFILDTILTRLANAPGRRKK